MFKELLYNAVRTTKIILSKGEKLPYMYMEVKLSSILPEFGGSFGKY